MKALLYFHGKGGNAAEANHYKKFFPRDCIVGVDYKGSTPFETKTEFRNFYDQIAKKYEKVVVIANSIGAYFVMNALAEKNNFSLTVMKDGEHFFHTDEQMNFLDSWLKKCLENFL